VAVVLGWQLSWVGNPLVVVVLDDTFLGGSFPGGCCPRTNVEGVKYVKSSVPLSLVQVAVVQEPMWKVLNM